MGSIVTVILTDDYEVFGNGSGDIDNCLIEPTNKLLNICSKYEVPVTLFADVAEYWAFDAEEKKGTLPRDYLPATKMRNQLIQAVQTGHDVQLHLHPQWLNYSYDRQDGWIVDESMWRLPSLPYGHHDDRKSILGALYQSKRTLEDMLKPFCESYRCIAFRAGAWCIQPEAQVIKALKRVGIEIESTVAPEHYCNDGLTYYDFRKYLNISMENICWFVEQRLNEVSFTYTGLLEVPIHTVPSVFPQGRWRHTKRKHLGLYNVPESCCRKVMPEHTVRTPVETPGTIHKIMGKIKNRTMVDFTACSADEMFSAVVRVKKKFQRKYSIIPVVFIGHSKVFGDENMKELEKFIVKAKKTGVLFGKYQDLIMDADGSHILLKHVS